MWEVARRAFWGIEVSQRANERGAKVKGKTKKSSGWADCKE